MLAVAILAGGNASRLPGKLEIAVEGVPLLVRVYDRVKELGPVYLAVRAALPPGLAERILCTIVPDEQPGAGPLPALCGLFRVIREPRVFVTAGDAPFVDAAVARTLEASWAEQTQGVVPINAAGLLEPLCAVYDRRAFLQAAQREVSKSASVRAAVESLRLRRVRLPDERVFASVNTSADRRALLGT